MSDGLPRLVVQGDDAAVADGLRALQRAILQHPVAARAIVTALRAEGRVYAATPDGQRWAAALRRSPLVAQARFAFDAATLRALEGEPGEALPSAMVDALVQAGASGDVESLLAQVFALGRDVP